MNDQESIEIRIKEHTADETLDIYAPGAISLCPVCEPILGFGYPLWGVHLAAALALHSAHRAVEEMGNIPALTEEDRLFGRDYEIVDPDLDE